MAPAYPVLIENNVENTLPDGTVLRSTVYRPAAGGERFPVLLTRTPYGRDLAVNSAYFNPATVAARGFAVILQDCRGRFGSDGVFVPSVHEEDDGAATVEWAARLPYSTGKVGMWGRSYFAETQWRAARARPAGLRAIAPGVSAGGNANNGAIWRGGAFELGSRLNWGHASASLEEIRREHGGTEVLGRELEAWAALDASFADGSVFDTLPYGELKSRAGTFMNTHILPSGGEDPGADTARRWDSASADPVDLPTLHIGGWFDIFAPNTLDQYRRQLEHSRTRPELAPRLIVGPWSHTNFSGTFPDVSFGMLASAGAVGGYGDLSAIHAAWFDAVLNGNASALAAIPPVLVFFMGENRWRSFDELPAPSSALELFLGVDGSLAADPGPAGTVGYDYDPLDPVPTTGGATMLYGAAYPGPADQHAVETRADVVVFTSEPLKEPLTAFGEVTATLFAASSAVDTDFVVRLCRVAPDGTSTAVTDGIVRASWRAAHAGDGRFTPGAGRRLLEPGRMHEFTVSLWATAYTFAAGERIRVQVTSSCHPRWDRNLNTGALAFDSSDTVVARQSIHCGAAAPSRLTLGTL